MGAMDERAAVEALGRAREADNRMWSPVRDATSARQLERDRDVRAAVAAGMPLEQVADELGVRISDVERMITSDEG